MTEFEIDVEKLKFYQQIRRAAIQLDTTPEDVIDKLLNAEKKIRAQLLAGDLEPGLRKLPLEDTLRLMRNIRNYLLEDPEGEL